MIRLTTEIPRQRDASPDSFAEDARPVAAPDAGGLRGLLHDLGHGLATLALLVEAEAPGAPSPLHELLGTETARLLAIVHSGLRGVGTEEQVAVRPLLERIAAVAALTHTTSVVVEPGADVTVRVEPTLMWRAVSNVVDNAVRAAGPAGSVRLSVAAEGGDVVVEVVDDGPGFPRGPLRPGHLGLTVVAGLLDLCGGSLDFRAARPRGTRVRLALTDAVTMQATSGGPAAEQA